MGPFPIGIFETGTVNPPRISLVVLPAFLFSKPRRIGPSPYRKFFSPLREPFFLCYGGLFPRIFARSKVTQFSCLAWPLRVPFLAEWMRSFFCCLWVLFSLSHCGLNSKDGVTFPLHRLKPLFPPLIIKLSFFSNISILV